MTILGPITEAMSNNVRQANEAYRAREQSIVTPLASAESSQQIADRHRRVLAYEQGLALGIAVHEHNAKVITGPRTTTQKEEPDITPKKRERSAGEILAEVVRKDREERQRRGYGAPKKDK